ncbi:MAG: DUF72 domain-containing protein [Brevinematia bacterium]
MGKEMLEKIFIGTSGWSYEDWVGTFYPPSLPKNKFLLYYSQYFNTVEINFSYYRIPNRYTLISILRNVPRQFLFTIKLYSSFTHQKDFDNPYSEVPQRDKDEFLNAIEVLKDSNSLDTVVAQFPQSFRFSPKNLEYVAKLGREFREYNFAVEFRNRDWYNNVVYDILKRENFTFISVDEPEIKSLPPRDLVITNRIGYIRLHSRDASKWYEGEKLRYDYYYSDDELTEWINKIKENQNFDKLYVFFNNCHNGQAVKNALRFKELLENYL